MPTLFPGIEPEEYAGFRVFKNWLLSVEFKKIIISPIINQKWIMKHFKINESIKTLWGFFFHVEAGKERTLVVKTQPGFFYHFDSLNILFSIIDPSCYSYYFLGAAGNVSLSYGDEELYLCGKSFYLSPNLLNEGYDIVENGELIIGDKQDLMRPVLLSLPMISLENKDNLNEWKEKGVDIIDMEGAYLAFFMNKRELEFYPLFFITDIPENGETMDLNFRIIKEELEKHTPKIKKIFLN